MTLFGEIFVSTGTIMSRQLLFLVSNIPDHCSTEIFGGGWPTSRSIVTHDRHSRHRELESRTLYLPSLNVSIEPGT